MKVLKWIGIAFLGFLVLGTIMEATKSPEEKAAARAERAEALAANTEQTEVTQATDLEAAAQNDEKTFNMTPEQFREKFNYFAKQVDSKYGFRKIEIKQGVVRDAFNVSYSFADNVALIGVVDKKTGMISSIMITIGGGNKVDTIAPFVLLVAATLSINQGVEKEENSKMIDDMLAEATKNMEKGITIEKTLGICKYTATAAQSIGIMFAVSPL